MSLELDVDILAVYQANSRIEDALNKRFEKDAEMYISNQDAAMIKEWLSTGQYELMHGKFKAENYHPDVFFRTILRNAWLIKQIKAAEFNEYFRPILNNMRPEFSKGLLREVAENKMDVPSFFRERLLKYYARSIDPLEAEDLLLSGTSLGLRRVKALVQRVLGQYAGSPLFVTKWNSYLKQYPSLGSDHHILKGVVVEEDRLRGHLEMIVNYVDSTEQTSKQFLTALGMGGLLSFELILGNASKYVNQIARQRKGVRDNVTFERMKLWLKQLGTRADEIFSDARLEEHHENVYDELIELYENVAAINAFQAGNILRYCFGRVRNSDLRGRIVEYFEYVDVHEKFEEDIEKLKYGNRNQEFEDVEEILEAVAATDAANMGRLQYLAISLLKLKGTENQINQLLSRIDLEDESHASFIIVLLGTRNKPVIWKKIIEYAERSREMAEVVVEAVEKYVPQDNVVRAYMHRNHFQKFGELYGV